MGKLSTFGKRLSPAGSRPVAAMSRKEQEAARFRERDQNVVWRAWYKTARWRKLREAVLLRDCYTCQKTGVICDGKYPADNSPVADHRKAHHGDEALFWDINNIETVSKAYHDKVKQAEERGRWSGLADAVHDHAAGQRRG